MTNSNSFVRIDWIDVSKGIAIAFVVAYHTFLGCIAAGLLTPGPTINFLNFFLPNAGVQAFFVLSGYLLERSNQSTAKLLSNTVKFILFPLVLWSVVQFYIKYAFGSYVNSPRDQSELWTFLYRPREQFWFLHALFFGEILYWFIFRRFKSAYPAFIAIGLIAIAWMSDAPSAIANVIRCVTFLLIGAWFFRHDSQFERPATGSCTLTLTIVIACAWIAQLHFHADLPTYFVEQVVIGLTGSLLLIVCGQKMGSVMVVPLAILGRYSMPIFVLHIIFGAATRIVLTKFTKMDPTLVIAASFAVGLFAPVLAMRLAMLVHVEGFLGFKRPAEVRSNALATT